MPRAVAPSSRSLPVKMSSGAQTLLLAAALHARPVRTAWLRALGTGDADVDALLGAGLLRETGGGLALTEQVDRDQLHRNTSWSQRRRLHRVLAGLCCDSADLLENGALHHEAAGEPDEAARAFLAAFEVFVRRRRHADALRAGYAALRILPSDTADETVAAVLRDFAQSAQTAGEAEAAAVFLADWTRTPPWRDRPAVRSEGGLAQAGLLAATGRHLESASVRRAAARDLADLGRNLEATRALLAAATTLVFAAQYSAAVETAEEACRSAELAGDNAAKAEATMLRGLACGMFGRTKEGRGFVEEALDLALRGNLPALAAEAYRLLGTVAEYASCYRDEQTAFAKAIAYCRRHDASVTAGLCLGCLSYSFFRSGQWKKSEATARRVTADADVHPVSRCVAEGVLGLLHAHRGETRPALKLLERSLEAGRRNGLVVMDFFSLLGLAVAAEADGRDEDAAQRYRALLDLWRSTEDRHDALPGLSCGASFFAERNCRDEVVAFAEALTAIAARTANPEARGAALSAEAELYLLEGEPKRAVEVFQRATRAYAQRELSVETLRVQLRLGCALLAAGRRDEARSAWEEARRTARRLGARPLAAKAEAFLLGEKSAEPTSPSSCGEAWDLLSPRQREVARFVAQGFSNKEIAERAGLSVRTVEMHVAGVLSRLGCRSRAQAAARVASALR